MKSAANAVVSRAGLLRTAAAAGSQERLMPVKGGVNAFLPERTGRFLMTIRLHLDE